MADEQRSRAPRRRLSEDLVVTEALALAEEGGLDAMTLRPLAARLGVTAAALYGHVGSRGRLLELMLVRRDAAQRRGRTAMDPDAGWADAMRWTADGLWDLYGAIPGLAAETLAGRITPPGAHEDARTLVALVEADGFEPAEAARIASTVVRWVLSYLAGLEHGSAGAEPAPDGADRHGDDPRATFDAGVELLVRGLQARQAA